MARIISFDMDGTLIDSVFTDWVWGHGVPTLYAKAAGISFEDAKAFVEGEYRKVGEGAVEWYDIKYWLRFFDLDGDWRGLLRRYADRITVYPEVHRVLGRLKEAYPLVLTSNAGREFIEVEMEATGLAVYFDQVFSATSDFREVKKVSRVYERVCEALNAPPGEIVHVGDHYEFDFLVPRAVGMHAVYLDRKDGREGIGVIRDLDELEAILPQKSHK
jgi:HAD superfamily hydrolase (TIGR01493 family)